VGIAVRTDDGRSYAWEFNLAGFDVADEEDSRDPKSIAYLAGRGVDFDRLPKAGVDGYRLRWLLRDSGLLRARPSWATFAGAYHVAYFVTIMYGVKLPPGVDAFMEMARQLLGSSLYDVKRLAREHDRSCVGALSNVAKKLAVVVVPPGDKAVSTKSNPAGLRDLEGEVWRQHGEVPTSALWASGNIIISDNFSLPINNIVANNLQWRPNVESARRLNA
jgi:hypothetical protein